MAKAKKSKQLDTKDLITSTGSAVLALGVFYVLFTVFINAILLSDGAANDTKNLIYAIVVMIPLSVYWIIAGRAIKRYVNQPRLALDISGKVAATVIVFALVNIAESVAVQAFGSGIIITTIFSIYMISSYRSLRSRVES